MHLGFEKIPLLCDIVISMAHQIRRTSSSVLRVADCNKFKWNLAEEGAEEVISHHLEESHPPRSSVLDFMWVLLPVVLAIFGTQSHGYEVYNIISQVNNGGSVQETVTIDSEKEVATINIHAGSCSSTTIFDYKHGYIASRLLSRRACYILKMNRQTTPSLEQLKQSIYETKIMSVLDPVQRLGSWASLAFLSVQTFTFKASAHWFRPFKELHPWFLLSSQIKFSLNGLTNFEITW
ncbi:gastrokine-2 isoform X2 [Equus caballus]|uniref:gastrokine-2 isoform X2 n=1 Tax=Equus caballus TaxID=9796 RepID=UPI0038B2FB64